MVSTDDGEDPPAIEPLLDGEEIGPVWVEGGKLVGTHLGERQHVEKPARQRLERDPAVRRAKGDDPVDQRTGIPALLGEVTQRGVYDDAAHAVRDNVDSVETLLLDLGYNSDLRARRTKPS